MREQEVFFFSEGIKLRGVLYRPEQEASEGSDAPQPVLLSASGYQGVNEIYPRLFAEALTARGFLCFGFDYRGFAESEGSRGRVVLNEQVEDVRSALAALRGLESPAVSAIGLIGWGMGASNVLRAAALDRRIAAVAALNGFYNGRRWLASRLPEDVLQELAERLAGDRISRAFGTPSQQTNPFDYYPLDPATDRHVQDHLAQVKGFGEDPTLELPESILDMNAEHAAAELNCPLLILHGAKNALHPVEEAYSLFEHAREPKSLRLLEGRHNDFMLDMHPVFAQLIDELAGFFAAHCQLGAVDTLAA